MQSFGIIVLGPIWGLISVQLFFKVGEEFIKAFFLFLGLFRRKVDARKLWPRLFACLGKSIAAAIVLVLGFWLLCVRYAEYRTDAQNILYAAFALLAVIMVVTQMPRRIERVRRHAMVAGAIEEDAAYDAEDEAEQRDIERRGPGVG